jgi:hypothetical protein
MDPLDITYLERLRAHGFELRKRGDSLYDIFRGESVAEAALTRRQMAAWDPAIKAMELRKLRKPRLAVQPRKRSQGRSSSKH